MIHRATLLDLLDILQSPCLLEQPFLGADVAVHDPAVSELAATHEEPIELGPEETDQAVSCP
jgi:hypothetical protein